MKRSSFLKQWSWTCVVQIDTWSLMRLGDYWPELKCDARLDFHHSSHVVGERKRERLWLRHWRRQRGRRPIVVRARPTPSWTRPNVYPCTHRCQWLQLERLRTRPVKARVEPWGRRRRVRYLLMWMQQPGIQFIFTQVLINIFHFYYFAKAKAIFWNSFWSSPFLK